jgi:hypothetical protein
MAKVVVLGLEGEEGLWVADLKAGTVTAVVSQAAEELRRTVQIAQRGISFATVANASEPLSGGYMDK